jgi:hypothetical protein
VIFITHSCIFKGINEAASFGTYDFFENDYQPGGKYQSVNIHIAHDIPTKKIPGKGKRHITMRTSDVKTSRTGPLYDKIEMVQYCMLESQHLKCKELAELGGPYQVSWPFSEDMILFCEEADFEQEPGFIEPPDDLYDDDDNPIGPGFYVKWTFHLKEYNKGI